MTKQFLSLICLVIVIILCTYLLCTFKYYETYSNVNENIISTKAYVGMSPNYYAYEMSETFFVDVLREIRGKDIIGSIDNFIITSFNDKLPTTEKHKYEILSTEIVNTTLNMITKQYIIYRTTKAYAISITIDYQTIDDKSKILFGKVDGFIFEDKLVDQSSFSPSYSIL